MSADFYLKTGDLAPPITVALKYDDGSAVDLSDADSVVFRMKRHGTEVGLVEADAVIDNDPTTGKAEYAFQSGETDEAGNYDGEFSVVWGAGAPVPGPQTFPSSSYVRIKITKRIPSP